MHTMAQLLVTPRGLRRLERERADLTDWLARLALRAQRALADRRKDQEIKLILSEEEVIVGRLERTNAALDRMQTLPPLWGHKGEARAGDTIYLRHKDSVRALQLAAIWNADPEKGKVSVISPIGQQLLGRHQGDKVRLNTLDGTLEYEILKII